MFTKYGTALCLAVSLVLCRPDSTLAASPKVPLRNVFEAVGATVNWKNATNEIEIRRGVNVIRLRVNSNVAVKNGVTIRMDSPLTVSSSGSSMISAYAVYPLAKNNRRERHYVVQSGDTLWKVAKLYGVSIRQLQEWNSLQSDIIQPGQHLSTVNPYYTVVSGDTLYEIAGKTEVTVEEIRRSNNLTSNQLTVGQRLKIPPVPSAAKPPMLADAVFPLVDRTYQPFGDTYGDARTFSLGLTDRVHEGNDITAGDWVPVFSVADGKVIRHGWNTYGGWRLAIAGDNGIAMYYAHLSWYADGVSPNSVVKKGQLIGYVGDTGYGPVGTQGKFVSHLHFGMYDINSGWKALNPYTYLKWWETK